MTGPAVVEEVKKMAEIQTEELLAPEELLAELLEVEATKANDHQQLNLSRETVLKILELFSKRESLTDEERKMIREMITDLSNELKDSKYSQAGIHLAFALVGGVCGISGGAMQTEWLKGIGDMVHGFGGASDPFFAADQVWMEVGKQLRMNDMGQADSLSEKIHKGMDRIMEAVQGQDSTIQRARTR